MNTIKIMAVFLFCFYVNKANAQNYNPFLAQALVHPSPMYDAASNGVGEISFNVGNSGDDPIPLGKEPLQLHIELSNGKPNHTDPLQALGGTYKSYFKWQYDAATTTYTGVQLRDIPGAMDGGVGSIQVAYKVTSNSVGVGPQNGLKATLIPPASMDDINSKNDDEVSVYTWTVLKFILKPDEETVMVNQLLTGDVSKNDKIEKGTVYRNAVAKVKNPSTCLPELEESGMFNFACPIAGTYIFDIEVCEPHPSKFCTKSLLTIKVLDNEKKK